MFSRLLSRSLSGLPGCNWLRGRAHRLTKHLAVWTASLIFAATASAIESNWLVRNWHPGVGLEEQVRGPVQTSDGFLWMATQNHLVRFDGVSFDYFDCYAFSGFTEPIRCFLKTRDDALCLALTNGRLVRLKSGRVEKFDANLPGANPRSLVEDSEGALWISYDTPIVCRLKDGQFTQFGSREGLSKSRYILTADLQGRVWFSFKNNGGLFREGRFETLLRIDEAILHIAPALGGGMWVVGTRALMKYSKDGTLEKIASIPSNISPTSVGAFLESSDGTVFVGTRTSGLFCYDGKTFENLPTSHNTIQGLLEDREGNIWVGTGHGVNRLRRKAISIRGSEAGLAFEGVRSLCEDSTGVVWAVMLDESLATWNGGEWSLLPAGLGPSPKKALCLAADPSGGVWIGTEDMTLYHLYGDKLISWSKREGLNSRNISSVLVARNGEVWLAGNQPAAIYRLRDGKLQSLDLPAASPDMGPLIEDSRGDIWGGGKATLWRFHEGVLTNEYSAMSNDAFYVQCFYAAPDGSLWIGCSNGGLRRFKDGRYSLITQAHGLYDENISQLIADDRGWLWFGSTDGIFKVRQDQLDAVANGRLGRFQSLYYGSDEGMPNLKGGRTGAAAALRTRDGRLWIPMSPALTVIDPAKLSERLDPPPVLIKSVSIDDLVIGLHENLIPPAPGIANLSANSGPLRLPADYRRRLEINFAALSYSASENVHYRYYLEGFDSKWIDAGSQRSASYPRLPAGQYQFRVTACNSEGVWNETGAVLGLTATPFVWERWWFKLGVVVIFAFSVASAVRAISFRRLRLQLRRIERETALERERSRIARDLHDELGAGLTHIVLLNELTLQNRVPPDRVTSHAQEIATNAREVIKSLDAAVWAINPRNDTLPDVIDYLSHFAVEFLRLAEIECHLDVPDEVPERPVSAELRHNLFLGVKEALNNIVRHAKANEAWLSFMITKSSLEIIVRDNGLGFVSDLAQPGADGLRNMKQRMLNLGGSMTIDSQLGAGTKVMFVCSWTAESVS